MSKPAFSGAALITRIILIALALALFIGQGPLMGTPGYWINLLAPIFFLAALRAASETFVRMDRGDDFGPAMVRGLKEIGFCLMLGAFAAIVVQPSLLYLFGNSFSEMRRVTFDLNVENVTLALIGVVLILLARQGEKLKSKLDEFV